MCTTSTHATKAPTCGSGLPRRRAPHCRTDGRIRYHYKYYHYYYYDDGDGDGDGDGDARDGYDPGG